MLVSSRQKSKMYLRRLLSYALVLAMLFSLMPPFKAYADENKKADAQSINAVDALGIDSNKAPKGFDPKSRKNPFGKETIVLNPVNELFEVQVKREFNKKLKETVDKKDLSDNNEKIGTTTDSGTAYLQYKLHGDGVVNTENVNEFKNDFTFDGENKIGSDFNLSRTSKYAISHTKYKPDGESQEKEFDDHTLYSNSTYESESDAYALTEMAAGNFNAAKEGEGNAKKQHIAMVYTNKLDKNGGLYLKFGDAKTGEFGSEKITLLNTKEVIGNPDAKLNSSEDIYIYIEDFELNPYQMRNYLKIATGDFNGDGVDEVAVYVPGMGKSKIVVFKKKSTSSTDNDSYKNADNWELAWTYSLKEENYVSNMVSLTAGDFNRDGVDDLAATWGYYYGPSINKNSKAVVMFGERNGNFLRNSVDLPLKYGDSNLVRASFIYDSLTKSTDGKGGKTLILGAQLEDDIKKGVNASRFVAFYNWKNDKFNLSSAKNLNLYAKDKDGAYLYAAGSKRDDKSYMSLPLMTSNMAVVSRGSEKAKQIYIDSMLVSLGDDGLTIDSVIDLDDSMQESIDKDARTTYDYSQNREVYAKHASYVEYGASSFDPTGESKDVFTTIQQVPSYDKTETFVSGNAPTISIEIKPYYKNWFAKLFGIKSYFPVIKHTEGNLKLDYLVAAKQGQTFKRTVDLGGFGLSKSEEVDASYSSTTPNTDDDSVYMSYLGSDFKYSDPKILAVLASPPYFKDLLRDDLDSNYGESQTSFTSSKSNASGDGKYKNFHIGAYFAAENSLSIGGFTISKAEFEASVEYEYTNEYEKTSEVEQAISYNTVAGQDMVALYSIPTETYYYKTYTPGKDGKLKETISTINKPHEANIKMFSVEEYSNIAKSYTILPKLQDNILTHTVGDPKTYTNTGLTFENTLSYAASKNQTPAGVGFNNSSIAQEITFSEEESEHWTKGATSNFKIGGGGANVVVGVVGGGGGGKVYSKVNMQASTYTGEIHDMPAEAKNYNYGYNWRILAYNYKYTNDKNEEVQYPVVTYLVSDVSAPPNLPSDFEQDYDKSTDSKNVLTWSYDKAIAGFTIFKYYDFPQGGGAYEQEWIPYTEGEEKDGKMYFSFEDTGLSPYTEYKYKINAVQASKPNTSIPSPILVARTKASRGMPNIEVRQEGKAIDKNIRLYPDGKVSVDAVVTNSQDYKAGGFEKPRLDYQWQKLNGNKWEDIKGESSSTLVFEDANYGDQNKYRVRVNAIYFDDSAQKEMYISAYSKDFGTSFQKRSVKGEDLKVKSKGSTVNASIKLGSAHNGHSTVPQGKVEFTLTGIDSTGVLNAELDDSGTAECNFKDLQDGIYRVSARYESNKLFDEYTSEVKKVLVGSDAAYVLELFKGDKAKEVFEYGDSVSLKVTKFDKDEKGDTSETAVSVSSHSISTTEVADAADSETQSIVIASGTGAELSENTLKELGPVKYYGVEKELKTDGKYQVKATVEDGNETVTVNANLTVKTKDVLIEAEEGKGSSGSDQNPELKIADGNELAFGEKLVDLGLGIIAKNTAANVVELNDKTEPGKYSIIGYITKKSKAREKYNLRFKAADYIVEAGKYQVSYSAEELKGVKAGTVSISPKPSDDKKYASGTAILVTAKPYSDFELVGWRVKNGDGEPKYSAAKKGELFYSHKMEDETVEIAAVFKNKRVKLTTNVIGGKKNNAPGTITPPKDFSEDSILTPGAELKFTAKANEGYKFKEWSVFNNNQSTSYKGKDVDGGNEYVLKMPSSKTILSAVFERDSYKVSFGKNIVAYYMLDHDNNINTPEIKAFVDSGSEVVGDTDVIFEAKPGYSVAENAKWNLNDADLKEEDANAKASEDNTRLTVSITAETKVDTETTRGKYNVTLAASNGKIKLSVDGKEVQANEEGIVENVLGGSKLVATAIPDYRYEFKAWSIDNKETKASGNVYVVSELPGNIKLSATFAERDSLKFDLQIDGDPSLVSGIQYSILSGDGVVHANAKDYAYTVIEKPSQEQGEDEASSGSEQDSAGGQDNDEQASGEQASGEQTSGEQANGEQASGEQASGEQASGEQTSGEQASGEQASGEQASGEQASDEQASGEQANGEQANGEQASGEQASGEQASGEQASGEQASGEQASGEQDSGEQASGEQASGEQASGEQASGAQASGEQDSGEQANGEQASGEQASDEQANDNEPSQEKQEEFSYKNVKLDTLEIYSGDSVKIKLNLKDNGMVTRWFVNDELHSEGGEEASFENLTANASIRVVVSPKQKFEVNFEKNIIASVDGEPIKSGDAIGGGKKLSFTVQGDDYDYVVWTQNGEKVKNKDYKNALYLGKTYEIDYLNKKVKSLTAETKKYAANNIFQVSASGENVSIGEPSYIPNASVDNKNYVVSGGIAKFTVTPNEGYKLKDSTVKALEESFAELVKDKSLARAYIQNYKEDTGALDIVLEGVEKTIELKNIDASMIYTISTVTSPETGGSVSTDVQNALEGSSVSVSAKANSSYRLKEVQVKTANNGEGEQMSIDLKEGKFTMPASNVVVKAIFEYVPRPSSGGGSTGGGGGGGSSSGGSGGSTSTTIKDDKVPLTGVDDDKKPKEDKEIDFIDVSKADWFYNSVKYTVNNSMMNGVGNKKFAPRGLSSRAMIVTILWRMDGEKAAAKSAFTDVPENAWYYNAVNWASANKIVNGMSKNAFAPDANITREQLATIVHRFVEYKKYNLAASEQAKPEFKDESEFSDYAKLAIDFMAKVGLMRGDDTGRLNPKNTASRAEIAEVMTRLHKAVEAQSAN